MARRIGKWTGLALGGVVVAYLMVAAVLLLLAQSEPFARYPIDAAQWRKLQEAGGARLSSAAPYSTRQFTARDGTKLAARVYGPAGPARIVYLHGANADSAWLAHSASLLQSASGAQVITPDARGHGASGGERHHVRHVGQYEEDLADILAALRREDERASLFVAGHSMGGGVATRYALLGERPRIDGYILLAPNFGDGPTQHPPREGAGSDADPARRMVYFDKNPFIGTLMLNILGITAANETRVLYFNHPRLPVAYSYAAVMSAQPTIPNDAPKALAAMQAPLLVLVGAQDEVFNAAAYPAFVAEHGHGETIIVPDRAHNGLINDPAAMAKVGAWIQSQLGSRQLAGAG